MKKRKKIEIITKAITEIGLCRCSFSYSEDFFYYYPNEVNKKFFLGQTEADFQLDGYCIRKMSQLKKVEVNTNKCNEINKRYGITRGIKAPDIDLSDWRTISDSLKTKEQFIIVEDEIHGEFAIGVVVKAKKNKLFLRAFDADGVWYDDILKIPYSTITNVEWGTRYSDMWERYMKERP